MFDKKEPREEGAQVIEKSRGKRKKGWIKREASTGPNARLK